MSIQFFWQLPADGDGRSFSRAQWHRGDFTPATDERPVFARSDLRHGGGYTWFDYLSQVARAADIGGFDGVLIPQTPAGEEPLIVAGGLTREVKRLTFVPSLPAPFLSAVYAAKIAVSFQRLSGDRLAWHLVTDGHGGNDWHGHHWSERELIERTGEFLDVVKGVWNQPPFTYQGRYYEVENGGFVPALADRPRAADTGDGSTGKSRRGPVPTQYALPTIYLSGNSEEALALSARHADVHILPLDTPLATKERIARLNELAAAHNRRLRFAIRAEVVAREQSEAAWQLLQQQWQAAAIGERFDEYHVDSRIWSGFRRLRADAASGLVGSYEELAARIGEYAALGVDTFLLSSQPHLEEAFHLGTKLLPLVRARQSARK